MIRQRINLPLTILSDAAHIIIPINIKLKMMVNDLFSSQHLVDLIFLAEVPTVTLIPPSSQFLKFSTSFFSRRIQQCINSMRFCVNGAKNSDNVQKSLGESPIKC
ncbi:hypothetical protein HZS_4373 [Henneguya salminicola]|nr:hypothetical protein HZS_4373 [Henneguya salminicola]